MLAVKRITQVVMHLAHVPGSAGGLVVAQFRHNRHPDGIHGSDFFVQPGAQDAMEERSPAGRNPTDRPYRPLPVPTSPAGTRRHTDGDHEPACPTWRAPFNSTSAFASRSLIKASVFLTTMHPVNGLFFQFNHLFIKYQSFCGHCKFFFRKFPPEPPATNDKLCPPVTAPVFCVRTRANRAQ